MQTDQWSTAHFTGTKINKVRWLPRYDQIGRASFFATGTWEEEVNKVTLWQLNLPEGDDKGADAPFECYESTHHGGVTDLKAVEANNQVYVLTTSTKGSYSLYQVPQDLFTGDVDEGQVASLPRELLASNLHTSAATAIDYSPELQEVVTVGEDGTINNLQLTATKPHVSFGSNHRTRKKEILAEVLVSLADTCSVPPALQCEPKAVPSLRCST
jgi:hypothetical protein